MNSLAVVTGGTKGIGRALVTKLLDGGFDVATCARHEKELRALQEEMAARYPQQTLHALPADLSTRSEVDKFVAYILSLDQAVKVLINNTGVFLPGQIHNEAEGTLEKTIETNVYSAYHLTRGLLDGMIKRREGHIFNICSTASLVAYPNGGSYCISKFALYGMTKVLREEMKPHGVKVTAVLPGATYTASWEGSDLPEERFMQPNDVATLIWSALQLSPSAVMEEILLRPQLGDID
ncbi:SDR family oxidoreductase [Rhabdobacter roseus]|uniref:Short-subunit dehydrogenase n=1 Tax=Rhabdobacter roseus TaxID=1655419 RepID=A0A840TF87_9BACT|nr:SDR family oxidoreductase [Rhabdobacter roseus]MBB5282164.1 short-subunit dehydrogenase [Rhabdobacter roseus]